MRSASRRSASLAACAFVSATALAGAVSTDAATITGVRGVVMRGPIMPVCREGQPCDGPAKKLVLHFVGRYSGGWTRTDLRGRYSLALKPGSYTVKIPSAQFGFRPRTVTVRANRTAVLNIMLDTGIR